MVSRKLFALLIASVLVGGAPALATGRRKPSPLPAFWVGSLQDTITYDQFTDPRGDIYERWEEELVLGHLQFNNAGGGYYVLDGGFAEFKNYAPTQFEKVNEGGGQYFDCDTEWSIDTSKPLSGSLTIKNGKALVQIAVPERYEFSSNCPGGTGTATQHYAYGSTQPERDAAGQIWRYGFNEYVTYPGTAYTAPQHHSYDGEIVTADIRDLRMAPTTFAPTGGIAPGISRDRAGRAATAAGTTISWRDTEPGEVNFTVLSCPPRKSCKTIAHATRRSSAGSNALRWGGYINGGPLSRGDYELEVSPTYRGHTGLAATVRFRIT